MNRLNLFHNILIISLTALNYFSPPAAPIRSGRSEHQRVKPDQILDDESIGRQRIMTRTMMTIMMVVIRRPAIAAILEINILHLNKRTLAIEGNI